jgi:hypothetical protein
MTTPSMTMMTEEDVRTEFGWNDDMIDYFLQSPDSPHVRRNKHTGAYTYGLYKRERVLAVAQSKGRDSKPRWDETLRGNRPNPGGASLHHRQRSTGQAGGGGPEGFGSKVKSKTGKSPERTLLRLHLPELAAK